MNTQQTEVLSPIGGAIPGLLLVLILAAPAATFGDPKPTPGTTTPPPKTPLRTPTSNKDSTALRQQARAALRAGRLDEVAQILEVARRIRLKTQREAWQVFEAEVLYTKKDYAQAALTAMRLVILSPKSPYSGDALYWAGKSYQKLGRPDKAAELFKECIDNKSSDEGTIRLARAALKPLTTQAAGTTKKGAP